MMFDLLSTVKRWAFLLVIIGLLAYVGKQHLDIVNLRLDYSEKNAELQEEKASHERTVTRHTKLVAENAVLNARVTELAAQESVNIANAVRAAERKADATYNSRLRDAQRLIDELRKRPARPESLPDPDQAGESTYASRSATGEHKRATGAELYREDAEFLVREASTTDVLQRDLNICITAYSAAQQAIGRYNAALDALGASPAAPAAPATPASP